MTEMKLPPYEHTDPQHPGSGCPGCTPLSHELEYLRERVSALEAALSIIAAECEAEVDDDPSCARERSWAERARAALASSSSPVAMVAPDPLREAAIALLAELDGLNGSMRVRHWRTGASVMTLRTALGNEHSVKECTGHHHGGCAPVPPPLDDKDFREADRRLRTPASIPAPASPPEPAHEPCVDCRHTPCICLVPKIIGGRLVLPSAASPVEPAQAPCDECDGVEFITRAFVTTPGGSHDHPCPKCAPASAPVQKGAAPRVHVTPGSHQIREGAPFWVPEAVSPVKDDPRPPGYQQRDKVPGCITGSIHDAMTFGTRSECQAWIAAIPVHSLGHFEFAASEHLICPPGVAAPAPLSDLGEFEGLVEALIDAERESAYSRDHDAAAAVLAVARSALITWARRAREEILDLRMDVSIREGALENQTKQTVAAHEEGRRQGIEEALAAAKQAEEDAEWPTDAVRALVRGRRGEEGAAP